MKIEEKRPPREFLVGFENKNVLKDCGSVHLSDNEQLTFKTDLAKEYDVTKKDWGFYATPSANGRLKKFGFKTGLMVNRLGQIFVVLVENERQKEFQKYLELEKAHMMSWLDESTGDCPLCQGETELALKYNRRVPAEADFHIPPEKYYREYHRCLKCGHFKSVMDINLSVVYSDQYVSSTYGDALLANFNRIKSLPPEKSDNFHRVERIKKWLFSEVSNGSYKVLDIGSGLCIFLDQLKSKTPWVCTALDPDKRQAEHAKNIVGVESIHSDFLKYESQNKFNLITLNKVLEHVSDPVAMLTKVKTHLHEGGRVYVELPDGEQALKESFEREEFTIDHLHVFSFASFSVLVQKSGFIVENLERIREPSSKYTLAGLLRL